MQKQKERQSENNIMWQWSPVLVPQEIYWYVMVYMTIYLWVLHRQGPHPGGGYSSFGVEYQDSWNTITSHQPIRRKSHTLQPSPQILPIKTLPQERAQEMQGDKPVPELPQRSVVLLDATANMFSPWSDTEAELPYRNHRVRKPWQRQWKSLT